MFFVFTCFISELLLCAIFIELGKKRPPIKHKSIFKKKPKREPKPFVEVHTEDFDLADCDLQAAIWNTFVKKVNMLDEEGDPAEEAWVDGHSLAVAAEDLVEEKQLNLNVTYSD